MVLQAQTILRRVFYCCSYVVVGNVRRFLAARLTVSGVLHITPGATEYLLRIVDAENDAPVSSRSGVYLHLSSASCLALRMALLSVLVTRLRGFVSMLRR